MWQFVWYDLIDLINSKIIQLTSRKKFEDKIDKKKNFLTGFLPNLNLKSKHVGVAPTWSSLFD